MDFTRILWYVVFGSLIIVALSRHERNWVEHALLDSDARYQEFRLTPATQLMTVMVQDPLAHLHVCDVVSILPAANAAGTTSSAPLSGRVVDVGQPAGVGTAIPVLFAFDGQVDPDELGRLASGSIPIMRIGAAPSEKSCAAPSPQPTRTPGPTSAPTATPSPIPTAVTAPTG